MADKIALDVITTLNGCIPLNLTVQDFVSSFLAALLQIGSSVEVNYK